MHMHDFRAMGCQQRLILDSPDQALATPLQAAVDQIKTWEEVLSRFRPTSELSQLNRRAGTGWVPVSTTLWAALAAALWAAKESEGLVTPTVLTALEQAGYDRDFALLADQPEAEPTQSSSAAPDWRQIRLDPQRHAVALPAGMALDLGGSAKGWSADQTVQTLGRHAPALADLGGDLAVSGPRASGEAWSIAVADPTEADETIDLIGLTSGGVATSGRDWRLWRQGDQERHHIIDPRTGTPAPSDLLSVTIVAPCALAAEVAAKQVFILGRKAGLRWLLTRPDLDGLLVDDDGLVLRTANLHRL